MTRLESQPFFDDRGNLIIPQQMLEPQREEKVLTLDVPGHVVKILLRGRLVVSVQSVEESGKIVLVARPERLDDCADLVHAASSALAFWDNPKDAEAWNNY
jgi:hypothetical protein